MTKHTLKLDSRQLTGRKVKQLRRQNIVPANIFGNKIDSLAVQVSDKDFDKVFSQAGETSIIYATVDDESKQRPLLVSALQIHPVTGFPIHIDFHQVDLTQKVTATVPLVLTGTAPAVEDLGAVLVQMLDEIEVEALPADLPHEITLDISTLKEFGDSLTIKDIKIDTSILEIQNDPEEAVVQTQEPQAEEEPVVSETPEAEAAAPATTEEAKTE